jgi:hypothetical protein
LEKLCEGMRGKSGEAGEEEANTGGPTEATKAAPVMEAVRSEAIRQDLETPGPALTEAGVKGRATVVAMEDAAAAVEADIDSVRRISQKTIVEQ